jgi:AcrR family transcriptional regulator
MRDGKATKARISRIALGLFVKKGVAETTVRDIAASANVAEGTLYRHFTGKDDLAWELFAANFAAFAGDLDRCQKEKNSLAEKMAVMVEHFCTFFDQDPVLFSYLLLVQHDRINEYERRRCKDQDPGCGPGKKDALCHGLPVVWGIGDFQERTGESPE